LLDQGADVNAKMRTADRACGSDRRGNVACVKLLISRGADVNHADKMRQPLLLWCVTWTTPDMLELLVKSGAGSKGGIYSAERRLLSRRVGRGEAVRTLVALGADVNAKDGSAGPGSLTRRQWECGVRRDADFARRRRECRRCKCRTALAEAITGGASRASICSFRAALTSTTRQFGAAALFWVSRRPRRICWSFS